MQKSRIAIAAFLLSFAACTKKAEVPAPTTPPAAEIAQSEAPAVVGAEAPRVVELSTVMVNGAVHWMPDVVEVKPGESIRFVLKHELEGGFDFHGFSIPALKIAKQVNRRQPLNVDVELPLDMAPGEYPIACQFHPKHVGAKLVVK